MKIPEEIRKVKRPVNTIVEDSGRDGPKRYSVRERSAVKYVPGANYHLPRSVFLFSPDQFSTLSRSSDLLHSDH